jgi:hypothetical protein
MNSTNGPPTNPRLKGFFKALAVKEMRTFGIILARMIPMHVTTNNLPTYLTEEQMRAELRAPPRGRLAAAEQSMLYVFGL